MKTKKRLLGILLSLALMLGLMPGMSMTARAEDVTNYSIWIGGTQVTSENATSLDHPTWSYDVDSNTLTLNGVSISTGYKYNDHWGYSAGIYYDNGDTFNYPLNIILKGTNAISGNGITTGIYGGNYYGSFTFSGNGSLTTTGRSSGIGTYSGSVEIDSGTIEANGTGNESSGIYTGGSITINGGNIEATGTQYGISAKGFSITGGTVIATAKNSTNVNCYAINESSGSNGISITGGTVTASGTSSGGDAYGMYLSSSGTIKFGADITSLTVTGKTSASHGKVENSLAGMGWSTVAGTGEGTEIAVNTSGASLESYKKLLFPYKKPAATVTTAPKANDLSYNGKAQELVNAGTASGGTMNYALGTSATTAPTDGWSTSIPTGTDVKTYYVWYKAVGDATHSDTEAACVTVTITDVPKTNSLYRIYNPNSGEHFFTTSAAEKNNLVSVGWRYEGVAWSAPKSGTPVLRLYNPNAGDHHYTTSTAEKNNLVKVGWRYEGVAFYSGGSKPVYRAYNPNAVSGAHHFTISLKEKNNIVKAGWRYEGVGFYTN